MRKLVNSLVLLFCLLITTNSAFGKPNVVLSPPYEGCFGQYGNSGPFYVKMIFPSTSFVYAGTNIYLWIETPNGLLGPVLPYSVVPSSYVGGYDYLYDLTLFSSFPLSLREML